MSNNLVPQSVVDFIIQAVMCTATNMMEDTDTEMAFIWGETVYQPDTVTELEKHRHRIKYNARARALWNQVNNVLGSELEIKVTWKDLDYMGREAMVLYFE